MGARNILFIINPIAGGRPKTALPALIRRYLQPQAVTYQITYTTYAGHANEIARNNVAKFDVIVALGGDGTINETAAALVNTNTCLGIVPLGSGNGLARFLKLPLQLAPAIRLLNNSHTKRIDTARLNGHPFFNVAGIGFDGLISAAFAKDKQRGFLGYIKLGLAEFSSYRPKTYRLVIDGHEYTREAFAVSVANSSQYGNNAHIAPGASITDGLLDVCIIKPLNFLTLPVIGFVMLNKLAGHSPLIEIIKGRNIQIHTPEPEPIHIDGEPGGSAALIDINILPASLSVVCP